MTAKLSLFFMLTILINLSTNASLFDRLSKRFLRDSFSNFHGEGLPKKVGQSIVAIAYRERFMSQNGIYSEIDKLGIEQFFNNDIGLALIKRGNGDEAAFNNVLAQKNFTSRNDWKNGPQFISVLEDYTKNYGCI